MAVTLRPHPTVPGSRVLAYGAARGDVSVPNDDLGEEVKAVIEVMPGVRADAALADELIAYCRAGLAKIKCPRSIDFIDQMPRLPTGKLYKKALRDKYWGERKSRIL